jgi:hypothetical protein
VTSGHSVRRQGSEEQVKPVSPVLPVPRISNHIAMDRDTVKRGLASLVLTVVELLRQLMERQAVRRVDQGDLTDEQIEQIGSTLMALDARMSDLCDYFEIFEITREELNLDLGPLGPLLSRD